jgi:hypothetical protein
MANTPPTIVGIDAPTFTESSVTGTAQLIDANVTLTDPDDNFSGGLLTVSGLLPEDAISIRNRGTGAGEVGLLNGAVTYGGMFIGFAGMVNGTFSVLFGTNATTAAVEAVIENLTYANASDTPTATRTLQITLTDSAGASAIAPLSFTERTGSASPFDGLDVGNTAKPSFADLDGDGDLDAIVGAPGDFKYFENVGTASAPEFAPAAVNPFGLTNVGFNNAPAFADLDNDGDLDLLVGEFNGGELNYFQNTGTASNPAFAASVENPFGLADLPGDTTPSFIDLDGDGDLDAVIGDNNGFLYYFQNVGAPSAPAFAAPLVNPFGLTDVGSHSTPTFADLDGDGDFDLLVGKNLGDLTYFENVGTPGSPAFAPALVNPFGLGNVGAFSAPVFADLDGDGDLDVVVGKLDGTSTYFENTTPPPLFEVTITVTSENDAPVLAVPLADQFSSEDQAISFAIPTNAFSDPDGDALTYMATLADGSALPEWLDFDQATRAFSGAPPLNFSGSLDIKVTAHDASPGASDVFTLTVTSVNDAPVVSGPVTLAAIEESSGQRLITQAELLANASDIDGPSLAAVNLQIAAGAGTLANLGNGFWAYTPAAGDGSEVTFSYEVTDGTASVAASAELDIMPAPAAPEIDVNGTSGDDGYVAPTGSSRFNGFGGIDTIAFNFKLTEATISWSANQVIVDGPSSHIVLTGFERFVFTDGIVDNNDGNWLVDDLFYYARNRDVWNARVDADAHYDQFGWHEHRDPNAFFDTSLYLALNPDVKASGVNPLSQFHQSGWTANRDPSFAFDVSKYLAANPDIAAARVDPLEHFLRDGAAEGRLPFAVTDMIGPNGFDAYYYMQNNPDVATAGVDPFQHFQTHGWREGRNPNAFFDTAGYLSAYADVAAAGLNPLDHYHQFGWREGRDPSVGFDTTDYLAAYADVAAGGLNPLVHYLAFGMHEGRSPFADGVFG